ncbi:MAG: D-alanyl-D-alanine carboxypeptidase/D-alanyl-D-alanine-endopeptidase [bacterium]|nr:D-alanyl-D-alanine carboxypeptidase/D-alanyl-D-alanine-endopeptidase [bacterium]
MLSVFILSCGRGNRMNNLGLKIKQSLEKTLETSLYKGVRVGIVITGATEKEALYSRLENEPLMVASVLKLVSSSAGLMLLGTKYKFRTPVMTSGSLKNGTLSGDLYLTGRGDPCLMTEHLEQAADELVRRGIRQIEGDIVYDVSFLDKEENRYGRNARNLYAPPSALTVNYNWIDVKVEGRDPPLLSLVPKTGYAQLKYDVTVSDSALPGRPDLSFRPFPWGDAYTVKGTITAWDRQYHYVWLGVSRPGLYAATLFREICSRKGIRISGLTREGKAPGDARTLVTLTSSSMKETVRRMNQESNNVIAETLCKDFGAIFDSQPGTRSKGVAVLEKFCEEKLRMEPGKFFIKDASGLDPGNCFTARQIATLLNILYNEKKLREPFVSSLAEQGHHPHALDPVPPQGISCYVKSGTLSVQGVNTAAGYIIVKKTGLVFSFVLLANREEPGPMTYSGTLTNPLLEAVFNAMINGIP